jgi:putative NIF3 family GTP cyclohydrolase 1 type 2
MRPIGMRLDDIYRRAIEMGMEADPREKEAVEAVLREARKRFDELKGKEREWFDQDDLWNPYADSRILFGDPDTEIGGLMVGVDITPGEAVLADRLKEKGRQVDAILGHHPLGRASANFYEVMHLQENVLEQLGIGINVAEGILTPRITEVMQAVHPRNHDQPVDACRLLDMPLFCLHTPADNQVQRFLDRLFERKGVTRVREVIEVLKEVPEYEWATRNNAGPRIFVGEKERKAGKVVVDMTGGTTGPKEGIEKMVEAGVGTMVSMHMPKEHIEEAKKHHLNVVVAGHMASDSLGLNLLVDKFEEWGVSIIPCSGYIRVKRS